MLGDNGSKFWYCKRTGLSQWEAPQFATNEDGAEKATKIENMDDWEEVDNERGDKYWYCTTTGISQWERPRFVQDSYGRKQLLAYMRDKLKKT